MTLCRCYTFHQLQLPFLLRWFHSSWTVNGKTHASINNKGCDSHKDFRLHLIPYRLRKSAEGAIFLESGSPLQHFTTRTENVGVFICVGLGSVECLWVRQTRTWGSTSYWVPVKAACSPTAIIFPSTLYKQRRQPLASFNVIYTLAARLGEGKYWFCLIMVSVGHIWP